MPDLTVAGRCYLEQRAVPGFDLTLMVVRCILIGVNEVKMSTGKKRLRPVYSLCLCVGCCSKQIEWMRLNTDAENPHQKKNRNLTESRMMVTPASASPSAAAAFSLAGAFRRAF